MRYRIRQIFIFSSIAFILGTVLILHAMRNVRTAENVVYEEASRQQGELSDSSECIDLSSLFGINSEQPPIGRLPESKIGNNPIRLGYANTLCRRFGYFSKHLQLPLFIFTIKTNSHVFGRLVSVDYYIYMLRRIII